MRRLIVRFVVMLSLVFLIFNCAGFVHSATTPVTVVTTKISSSPGTVTRVFQVFSQMMLSGRFNATQVAVTYIFVSNITASFVGNGTSLTEDTVIINWNTITVGSPVVAYYNNYGTLLAATPVGGPVPVLTST